MEPVTLAIVTALSAGVLSGASQVAEQAVVDAYEALKSMILDKYGKKSDLQKALENVEEKPDSEGRKLMLNEEVIAIGANKDDELLEAAQALLKIIEQKVPGISVVGDRNIVGVNSDIRVIKQKAGKKSIQIGQANEIKLDDKKVNYE